VADVSVTVAGRVFRLLHNDRLTFGRARDCTVCLDPEDTGISRLAGTIDFENGMWWVHNSSDSRQLSVIDDLGLPGVLPPHRRRAVEALTQIIIDGTRGRHSLRIAVDGTDGEEMRLAQTASQLAGVPTAVGAEVMISHADRLAMVALFAGYLDDPPRYDPHPKKYAAAAARLGWPRTTLVKRIEYLRARLFDAGVPNMTGVFALSNLAEYAISRRLITRGDLVLLQQSE
jgi:hypothetical protein